MLATAALGGCGAPSNTPLPEITTDRRPLLNENEQKRAIADLEKRKADLEAEAAKPVQ